MVVTLMVGCAHSAAGERTATEATVARRAARQRGGEVTSREDGGMEDPLAPAKGVIRGIGGGAAIWVVIAAIVIGLLVKR